MIEQLAKIVSQMKESDVAELIQVMNTWTNFKNYGGSIADTISIGHQDSVIDKLETSKTYLVLKTLNGRGTQLVLTDDGIRPSTDQPKKINIGIPTTPFKDIYVGEVNKSLKGHCTLPNGMLMQWGYANEGKEIQNISFLKSFSNNNYNIQLTPYSANSVVGLDYRTSNAETTGFTLHSSIGAGVAYYWLAIGW